MALRSGSNGAIRTSPDGITWTIRYYDPSDDFNSVTYGLNLFVAVGYNGRIVTSSDGMTWTVQSSGTTNYLYSVAYGGNKLVAVGDYGTVLVSPDGTTWDAKWPGTENSLHFVTYVNDHFVAVGDYGTILSAKADNSGIIPRSISIISKQSFKLSVFTDRLSIQLPDPKCSHVSLFITILSAAGKTIYFALKNVNDGSVNVSIAGVPNGIYIAKINNRAGVKYTGLFAITR
jgi:hypothetical protein